MMMSQASTRILLARRQRRSFFFSSGSSGSLENSLSITKKRNLPLSVFINHQKNDHTRIFFNGGRLFHVASGGGRLGVDSLNNENNNNNDDVGSRIRLPFVIVEQLPRRRLSSSSSSHHSTPLRAEGEEENQNDKNDRQQQSLDEEEEAKNIETLSDGQKPATTLTKEQEEKRKRSARRVACQSVPYWLKTEPYCFERTVSALNLNMMNNNSNDNQHGSSNNTSSSSFTMAAILSELPGQYRKAYKDSIPSYFDNLQEGRSNTIPKSVEDALDKLVQAGFDDMEFAKQFRSIKSNQIQFVKTATLLRQKEQKYQKRIETAQIIQEKIIEMEKQLKLLIAEKDSLDKHLMETAVDQGGGSHVEENNSTRSKTYINPLQSVVSMVREAMSSSSSSSSDDVDKDKQNRQKQQEEQEEKELDPQTLEHQQLVLGQSISKLQRQIDGRRSHLESHERGTQKTLEAMEELKRQKNKSNSTMTAEVYEETQKVVREAMLIICDNLADHIQQRHSNMIQTYQNLDAKTDLTKPNEWYPYARLIKRKIIYHGGPTNSGKTYSALQRLKQAKKGMYLGPLRLLAAEVYEKLNSEGVYTSLVTGQERREFPFSTHIAATVEMAGMLVEEEFDVIVIDEIQMIEDNDRGFAWTRALLGMRCKEIHVCGGLEAKTIVERIVEACGDDFELKTYDRFSALGVATKSLSPKPAHVGAYKEVQPGDCVVAFSRNDIFAIQREIEGFTKYKCCVIYGTLPPDIRTAQAQLFNDPKSGYDVLVASDAISMGLNLNIRRIIFNSIYKNDGGDIIRLGHSAVKQIAGRAGRRNSPFPNGEVTCRDPRDLAYIQNCMKTEIEPIEKAGLIPTGAHVELFGEAFQQFHYGTNLNEQGEEVTPPLHTILKEFNNMAVVRGDYFLCRQEDMHAVAKLLKDVVTLEIKKKYDFCLAPINPNNVHSKEILVRFAEKLGAGEVPGLKRRGQLKKAVTFDDLGLLCSIYSELDLFIWLQNKFPPINIMEHQAALTRKENTAAFITQGLKQAKKLRLRHCYVERDASLRLQVGPLDDDLDNDEEEFSQSEDEEELLNAYYS